MGLTLENEAAVIKALERIAWALEGISNKINKG